ncbi:uroporphyrinogen-III C-methyltransferase [Lysobacter enzymogenes]|uniref:uroporphyrinogen-III C-methyltransferase n=1 Tax=Lysobacter enzymogenes TaxID=69 RepID=UPI00099D5830|nr:uroporphyrinogen-III C-methyltransferase [Lysobacter enzymogenes]QQQ01659.1 uroporphyrinogen-III C-methyltransferase [Lysobacter enzymogenes]UZW60933.1 uroporphyrinogen-III C-methyltransferase [Lysobacter enzymogenes]
MNDPIDPVSTSSSTAAAPRRGSSAWLWLLLALLVAAGGGWFGWREWQQREVREREQAADGAQRLEALEQRVDTLRTNQDAQNRRIVQADSTNRVLRDELHGIGQRAALIEDSVSKLADPNRHGAQAMRLDETELLLTLGQQRLQIAGDLEGARRAYLLAGGVLDGIDDPAYLSLRQTLLQETAALKELGIEPRMQAMAKLDALAQGLSLPEDTAKTVAAEPSPWWRRAFGTLIETQPVNRTVASHPADRAAALAGLQLEISLARAAAERRDAAGYKVALKRAEHWVQRLSPPSPAQDQQLARLRELAAMPLSLTVPTLGTTLQQLRQLRTAAH